MANMMKINDAAKKYKTTKRSLRYYEEAGLLKSIRIGASQTRHFDEKAINRLEQVLLLRSVKFTINEITQVLLSDSVDTAFKIFTNRLNELDGKINELNNLKTVISSFLKIGKSMGISNINIYQLLKDQIYIHNSDERMIKMEINYDGDIVKFEFGLGIIPYINIKENDNFLDKIRDIRNKIESETKREIPLIRVSDNGELGELQYRISVKGKMLIDNNLEIIPLANRVSEMLRYLEFIIKSNIDAITPADGSEGARMCAHQPFRWGMI